MINRPPRSPRSPSQLLLAQNIIHRLLHELHALVLRQLSVRFRVPVQRHADRPGSREDIRVFDRRLVLEVVRTDRVVQECDRGVDSRWFRCADGVRSTGASAIKCCYAANPWWMMRPEATLLCTGHSGLRQLSFFTSRGPCRRKNCSRRRRETWPPPSPAARRRHWFLDLAAPCRE